MKIFSILFTFIGFSNLLLAQRVENVRFEQQGRQIVITYDLPGIDDEQYEVSVYCSTDGGTTWGQALQKVTGQVGVDQTAGTNKKIIWDVLAEREKLEGNIVFEISIKTMELNSGTFLDARDGHVYKWVRIGGQVWMAENLAYLPSVSLKSSESKSITYYYVYDNYSIDLGSAKAIPNYSNYGVLYNWPAAMESCPSGWHLPNDEEWTELTNSLSGTSLSGGKLKEASYMHWISPNTGATNEVGFTALPGGFRNINGDYTSLGNIGGWWSSSEQYGDYAWILALSYSKTDAERFYYVKEDGYSVRCVRDY
jgi:uncharacterized protein (TIGR02145 family)